MIGHTRGLKIEVVKPKVVEAQPEIDSALPETTFVKRFPQENKPGAKLKQKAKMWKYDKQSLEDEIIDQMFIS